jgi:hypothetical protein
MRKHAKQWKILGLQFYCTVSYFTVVTRRLVNSQRAKRKERRRGKVLRALQYHCRKHPTLHYLHTTIPVKCQPHKQSVLLKRLPYDQAAPNPGLAVPMLVRQVLRSTIRKASGECSIAACYSSLLVLLTIKKIKIKSSDFSFFLITEQSIILQLLICNELQAYKGSFGPMSKHNAMNHMR